MLQKTPFTISSEGNELRGMILRPGEAVGPNRAVIICHGFQSSMHVTRKYAPIFTELGYTAVIFDFTRSGSGTSGGDSTTMSVLTEKQDLFHVMDYICGLQEIDERHLTLSGCSQGGFVAALAAGERPEAVEHLVLFYPGFSIPHYARFGYLPDVKVDPNNIPETFKARKITLGRVYLTDAMKLDPWREIRPFQKPVIIVHGKEDEAVDVRYSELAAKEYKDCTLIEVHGDHGLFKYGFRPAKAATQQILRKWDAEKAMREDNLKKS